MTAPNARFGTLFKRTAQTLDFPEKVIEMPFPVQRVQTDREEFFAYKVQQWLMDSCIKFRPIRPGAPHLNSKAERAHRTDLEEFYATVNLRDQRLRDWLGEWQHHFN
jgi:transposase InsO family protein